MKVRISTLSRTEMAKLSLRMVKGTLTRYYDEQGYVCYDTEELKHWKPRRNGRPPKSIEKTIINKIENLLINKVDFCRFCEKNNIQTIKDLIGYFENKNLKS